MRFLVTGGTGFIGKRVVTQLLKKQIKVIATDIDTKNNQTQFEKYLNQKKVNTSDLKLYDLDISSKEKIKDIILNNNITHIIACGYQMSNLIDQDPVRGSEINIVGMTNLFQSVADFKLQRLIFPSSESVYGTSSKIYNYKPVTEDDFCGLQHHMFTYAVMKLLNEFMARKYVTMEKISIACTRPSVVFGYGRKRSSLMWAEEFATNPALGKSLNLPFPENNKDCFVYVEDCAEQLIELSLKNELNHFVYNTGTESATGTQLKNIIKSIIPDAEITFDENGKYTPFIDEQDDSKIREELSFKPRTLKQGIKEHMNEARLDNGLSMLD